VTASLATSVAGLATFRCSGRKSADDGEHTSSRSGSASASRERIQQIEAPALRKLRPPLASDGSGARPDRSGRR
jgi:hypothetical protein